MIWDAMGLRASGDWCDVRVVPDWLYRRHLLITAAVVAMVCLMAGWHVRGATGRPEPVGDASWQRVAAGAVVPAGSPVILKLDMEPRAIGAGES